MIDLTSIFSGFVVLILVAALSWVARRSAALFRGSVLLGEARKGMLRHYYVRHSVNAFNGVHTVRELWLLIYLCAAVLLIAQYNVKVVAAELRATFEEAEKSAGDGERRLAVAASKDANPDGVADATPGDRVAELRLAVEELRAPARTYLVILAIAYWGILCALAFFALVLVPGYMRTRAIAFHFERFISRIQGLASKSELAELAIREVNVRGEESLRHLLDQCYLIARRYDVVELVRRFDIWGNGEPRRTSA